MKKLVFVLAAALTLTACAPSGGGGGGGQTEYDITTYSLEKYLLPYWDTEIIYAESVLPLYGAAGELEPIELLYGIKEIISVRNSYLNVKYVEGSDYTVEGGKLKINPSGAIPVMAYGTYYPESPGGVIDIPAAEGSRYILYSETAFHDAQLAVTYKTEGAWEFPVPAQKGALLPKTLAALTSGAPLKIAFIGDSVLTGASSSGYHEINRAPNAPIWRDMAVSGLKAKYNNQNISAVSFAVGGKRLMADGRAQLAQALAAEPGLIVIGFGANDAGVTAAQDFAGEMAALLGIISGALPDCEVVICNAMLTNPLSSWGLTQNPRIFGYATESAKLEREGVAFMNTAQLHNSILSRKRYYDFTGNNVNHPNDFLARALAQTFIQTLETAEQ